MDFFLGIDGGQTSTTAVIGRSSGEVIGRGKGGPSNHVGAELGRSRLIAAVSDALEGACESAGLSSGQIEFAAVCMGATGGPVDKEPVLREILRVRKLSVTDDATIALVGAHAGDPGVITIAGTGSVSMGRNHAGECARAGGWGYALGDEGSAYDIVRQALRAALRFSEGRGPATSLHDLLLRWSGASEIQQMRRLIYTSEYPRPRVASIAPLVCDAALEKDAVACEILKNAVAALVEITTVVSRRLSRDGTALPVAYLGGVFRNQAIREAFIDELARQGFQARPPLRSPAEGALLEAIRSATAYSQAMP